MKKSFIVRAISHDGSARIMAADTTEIVQCARDIHGLSKTMSAVLGRSLTAASMMGSMLKSENNSLTLQFKGDGPAGTVCCVSDYLGNVKGYVGDAEVELPPNDKGKLDVGGAVGKGTMYVMKDLGMEEPYIGLSQIVSGEIAEDVTEYFATSEQTPSVCALGVRMNKDLTCKAAGGFLLQMMPFPDESIISALEANVAKIDSVSALIAEGRTPHEIIGMIFDGIEYDILDESEIAYRCKCDREKYYKALLSLKQDDLKELAESGEPVETCCNFCGRKYVFEKEEIAEMLKARLQ